jgi:hypothetical protein
MQSLGGGGKSGLYKEEAAWRNDAQAAWNESAARMNELPDLLVRAVVAQHVLGR